MPTLPSSRSPLPTGTLLVGAVLLGACSPSPPAAAPANVVVIVVDTLRADALGRVDTPHFDRLVSEGVRFEQAFSHAPMTLPAHTALFSSTYPFTNGVTNNGLQVSPELPLFASLLNANGYHCKSIVTLATMWPNLEDRGLDRGFDHFVTDDQEISRGTWLNAELPALLDEDSEGLLYLFAHFSDPHQPYNSHGTEPGSAELLLDGKRIDSLQIGDATWWDQEVDLLPGSYELSLRAERPFHVRRCDVTIAGERIPTAGFDGPGTEHSVTLENASDARRRAHIRIWVHDAPDAVEIRRRYDLEVAAADAAVGELLAELDQRGLYESSWIVFTSDHGEGLGEHGVIGHVRHLYDELLSVPLVIKPPSGHPRSEELFSAAHQLARHVDLVPTLTDVLELEPLPGAVGMSLLVDAPRVVMAETHPPEAPRHLVALRDESFKLVFDLESEAFEMYALDSDPGELNNVFAERGDELSVWQEELRTMAVRGAAVRSGKAVIDEELQRRLKALGYY